MSALRLTADLVAHAIIASARVYGDDPVGTLTVARKRRAIVPAVYGLVHAAGADLRTLCGIFEISPGGASVAKARAIPPFREAMSAAEGVTRRLGEPVAAADPAPAERKPAVAQAPRRVTKPEPESPYTLRGRILAVLNDAPSTSSSLAILTDAKELAVIEALRGLVADGIVCGGPVPPQGPRARQWSIVKEAA